MTDDFTAVRNYQLSHHETPFSLEDYERTVEYLIYYNDLFRYDETKAKNLLMEISPMNRKNLTELYRVVRGITRDRVDAIMGSTDLSRDAAVNLSLMWPSSWSIIQRKDFDPDRWIEELYPSIEDIEEVEEEIHERNKSGVLEDKVTLMNRLMDKVQQESTLNKDLLDLLTIQTELINQLAKGLNLEEQYY